MFILCINWRKWQVSQKNHTPQEKSHLEGVDLAHQSLNRNAHKCLGKSEMHSFFITQSFMNKTTFQKGTKGWPPTPFRYGPATRTVRPPNDSVPTPPRSLQAS